jgi:hypothetical protein
LADFIVVGLVNANRINPEITFSTVGVSQLSESFKEIISYRKFDTIAQD